MSDAAAANSSGTTITSDIRRSQRLDNLETRNRTQESPYPEVVGLSLLRYRVRGTAHIVC